MPEQNSTDHTVAQISSAVERLNSHSQELLQLMEQQIDAIIASDADGVERLTEEHTALIGKCRREKEAFVSGLRELIGRLSGSDTPVTLSSLERVLPEKSRAIEDWRHLLTQSTLAVQKKQKQVSELLDFAMVRNSGVMHAIYRTRNEANIHYNKSGDESGLSSGIAVNQEV